MKNECKYCMFVSENGYEWKTLLRGQLSSNHVSFNGFDRGEGKKFGQKMMHLLRMNKHTKRYANHFD